MSCASTNSRRLVFATGVVKGHVFSKSKFQKQKKLNLGQIFGFFDFCFDLKLPEG